MLCGLLNGDREAQRLELSDVATHGALGVSAIEVVGAQLPADPRPLNGV
jgi:hypothetical protein